ncbi:2-dehydro-3-deoxygluconokinase [Cryobacterium mesophilum]|uniref:Sugar kinase n=1 Tax=Terrimesophilobacter mesophilus TaxID=433647 RepID=A0A4R8VE13_9MICO|nr:sugar kinase [Terrimesophilobacter mesophilus]MBB5633705.1 2-dehydro-3-deoxygluconokinase [Terrimesophilobacter mesophilus]TFB80392.1 sugar kinase [Terrimesophilobacter mesophilus]
MTGHGVVTIGETMALLGSTRYGPLQHSHTMTLGIGGSESNVAIALSRLGADATWVGRIGLDPLGDLIAREITAEGVTVAAIRDPEAPTGLMLKERRTSADTRVWYYRRGNAGSGLGVRDIDPAIIRSAALLHVTGISLALSDGMSEAIFEAVRLAKDAGVTVSFDLNFRGSLWSRAEAADAYRRIVPLADIVFAGDDEAAILVGESDDPIRLAERLVALGAGQAIIKLGDKGAVAVVDGISHRRAAIPVTVVDTVGAGDAFVAGYLADFLLGESVPTRLSTAVAVGAYACTVDGDWEGSPRRTELALLGSTEPVTR